MSWQLLVGLTVVLYSVNGLLHRTIMKIEGSDAYAQAVVFTGLSSLIFLIVLLFRGSFQWSISWNQLILLVLAAFASSAGIVFSFKGFKSIGASEHTILLTSTQIWVILGAILFLHETLTVTKLIGAACILSGVVLAEWRRQSFVLNEGAVFVLLAALGFATSNVISYFIVRNFDVLSYLLSICVFVTSILIISRPRIFMQIRFYFKPKRALNIVATSTGSALANIFAFTAYQVGRNALQIGPIMATETLLTVLLAFAILKERDHLLQKIIGSLAALIGTIL
jgi:drug/metabolite transporter (DMT)-like permease